MPRRRGVPARRSHTEWAVRAILALIAAVLGYMSVAQSLADFLQNDDPALSHIVAPWDGRITARLARKLLVVDDASASRAQPEQLARLALRQDATAVPAVTTLALAAQLRNDTASARRLFAYAERLSRRDFETQLWWVEDAVGRGDIPSALRHYDVTLRISRDAPALMFPVLASAIADPAIRGELVKTLRAKPPWGAGFMDYAAVKGDPRSVAALFHGLRRAGVPVPDGATASLINSLVTAAFLEEAWQYYASTHPNADRRRSRDPQFVANVVNPSPFDWTPGAEAGIATSIQPSAKGGIFGFSAPASIGGTLLQQMQMLPPGHYSMKGHSANIDQPLESRPYWILTCRDGREIGRVVMPNSAEANGVFTGRFNVPTNCPSQSLALVARPSDQVSGIVGQIDWIQLVPAR